MRLLIADRLALFRQSLSALLEAQGFDVEGGAADGEEALRMVESLRPDVVIAEIPLPKADGYALARQLAERTPPVRVVLLTDAESQEEMLEAVGAGAFGYLPKSVGAERFVALLGWVGEGLRAATPQGIATVWKELEQSLQRERESRRSGLTPGERQVLELLVAGVTSNRELATRLHLTESAVRHHVRGLFDKLRVHSRAEAVVSAVRAKLADPPG
jgi:DNA-binding NarL/FixJ family response regulator